MSPDERRDLGPPGPRDGEGGPPPRRPADVEEVVTTPPITYTAKPSSAPPRQCTADTVAALHRRRRASWRLVPLDCGCVDPWTCRCRDGMSDRQVAGAVAAAHHLHTLGLPPIVGIDTLRAMWKAGHHQLVAELHRLAGGEAA